jgi:hypothetical protein
LIVDRDVVQRPRFEVARCRGAISVEVRDLDSLLVVGQPVLLYTGAGGKRTVNTDANGEVEFAALACGHYGVMAVINDAFDWVGGNGYVDGLDVTQGGSIAAMIRVRRR